MTRRPVKPSLKFNYSIDIIKYMNIKNMTGLKFGRLTFINKTGDKKRW
jgi:hypothetical protein